MIASGAIVAIDGERYKVVVGANISGWLSRLELPGAADYNLAVGDTVLVAFLAFGYATGVVLGRFEE